MIWKNSKHELEKGHTVPMCWYECLFHLFCIHLLSKVDSFYLTCDPSSFIIQGVKYFLPSASRFHLRIVGFSLPFPVPTAFRFPYPHRQCHTFPSAHASSGASAVFLLSPRPRRFLFFPSPFCPDHQHSARHFKKSTPSHRLF